tara:strand:- start:4053 stop:4319 length:267 start_codon:yes stop_codon:yes gene_type:complete
MSKEKINIIKPVKGQIVKVYLNTDSTECRYGIGRYMIGIVDKVKGLIPILKPLDYEVLSVKIDRFLEKKETIIVGNYKELKRIKEDGI